MHPMWTFMVYVHVHKNLQRAALSKSQIAAKLFLHTFKRSYLAPLLKPTTFFQKLKPNYFIAVTLGNMGRGEIIREQYFTLYQDKICKVKYKNI